MSSRKYDHLFSVLGQITSNMIGLRKSLGENIVVLFAETKGIDTKFYML